MRILITGAGGAAAISVWKSLNSEHEIHMADIDPCAAGLYLVPPNQRVLVPAGDSAAFVPFLLTECKKRNIELVIPTVDVELIPLGKAVILFDKAGIKLPISSLNALEICRDKYKLLEFFNKATFIPDYALYNADTDLTQISFPCFAKPRFGAGSRGVMVLGDEKDLLRLPRDGSYLIQEMLDGAEYSVDIYMHSAGFPLAAVPRWRMKIDSGIAVAAQTHVNPLLSQLAITVARSVGIKYVANIQFKAVKNSTFKLLEINPRFPGTLPLTAAAGIDIPKLLINDVCNNRVSNELMPFKELMVVRYWNEHFCDVQEWKNLCKP